MAANLAGMFQQMNQAIQANPMGQPTNASMPGMVPRPQDTLNPLLQRGLMKGMGAVGSEGDYSTSQQAMQGVTEGMGKLDLTTSQGLLQASKLFGAIGAPDKQAQLAQAGMAKAQEEMQLRQQLQLKASLAKRANAVGLGPLAESIETGGADTKAAQEEILKEEQTQALLRVGARGRVKLVEQMGFSPEEAKDLGVADWSEAQFEKWLRGNEGKTEAFKNELTGETEVRVVNKYGRIKGPDGMYRRPLDMGLTRADNITKVINQSTAFVDALGSATIDNIKELHADAVDANDVISIIGQQQELMQDMPTGLTAGVELWLGRAAEELGIDIPGVVNAQTFQANAANLVAKEIKAFGSGTGLSDADRDYAQAMVAGKVEVSMEAIKKILAIRERVARARVQQYNETKERIGKVYPDSKALLDTWNIGKTWTPEPKAEPKEKPALSESALRFF